MEGGRASDALAQFEEAARLAPESPEVGFLLGQAHAQAGQIPRAKQVLERARQQARASGDAELLKKIDAAIDDCRRLERRIPRIAP